LTSNKPAKPKHQLDNFSDLSDKNGFLTFSENFSDLRNFVGRTKPWSTHSFEKSKEGCGDGRGGNGAKK
jgi:hypothetical protein